jgi:hypothetical protein
MHSLVIDNLEVKRLRVGELLGAERAPLWRST